MKLENLKKYNGNDASVENKIYISLSGNIYDVSSDPSGIEFYGPKGPYHVFAGHEATMSLAKMSMTSEHLNKPPSNWHELDETEMKTLNSWVQRYKLKYTFVGKLDFGVSYENELCKKWA